MKKLKLIILLSLLFFSNTKAQKWDWLKPIGFWGSSSQQPLVLGNKGDLFGIIMKGDSSYIPEWDCYMSWWGGGSTSYVAHYESSGNILWQKKMNGLYDVHAYPNNDIIVNGFLYYTLDLGDTVLNNPVTSNSRSLIIRMDENGKRKDILVFKENNYCYKVNTDNSGNTYLTGVIKDSVDLKGQLIINDQDEQRFFIIKLDKFFNIIWHKLFDLNIHGFQFLTIDSNENVLLYGQYFNSLFIDNAEFGNTGKPNNSYLIKLDNTGNMLWHRIFKNGYGASQLGQDSKNNIYVSGFYQDSLWVSDTMITSYCAPNNCGRAFIAKYNSNGDFKWLTDIDSKRLGSYQVAFSPGGESYITGEVVGTLSIGHDSVQSPFYSWHPMIARIGTNGKLNWSEVYNADFSAPLGIAVAADESFYWSGFASKIKLGNDSVYECATGRPPLFLAHHTEGGLTSTREIDNIISSTLIYPNPSEGPIKIEIKNNGASIIKITVTSVLGLIVVDKILRSDDETINTSLDLSREAKGIYFIEISSGKQKEVRRIFVN